MWLSDYHKIIPECFSLYENRFYVDNILTRFSEYKNDDVVIEFMELVRKHQFEYDAPYALFLQLDEHFKCDKLDDYVFIERLEEDESIYAFLDKLEDFANRINFEDYYNSNIELYSEWTRYILSCFKRGNVLKFYENYFGHTDNEYYLNLIPFAADGSFSASIGNKIYDMNPVTSDMKRDTLFERDRIEIVISAPIHEFLHGYVNPITDKLGLLDSNTNLFDELKEKMSVQGYPTDVEIINEHLVRAIHIRYIINEYNDIKWAEYVTRSEEENGFIYIREILEKLEFFENNRNVFNTFDDFYPEIVSYLISKKQVRCVNN